MIQVSIVVPTCGREFLLTRCLHALRRQQFDPNRYEIVVADDSHSERIAHLVEKLGRSKPGPAIRYAPTFGGRGPAAARNRGWRAARGKVIAFTDDDCVPDPDWLSEGLSAFRRGTACVRGRVVMPLPQVPTDYERDAARLEQAEFVTANCFCRRDVLAALGGFDERFETAWREDSDLQFRLMEYGFRIADAPRALVTHPVRPERWGISVRQQRKIQFDALLYKKHPRLYREKISPGPNWEYYRIVCTLLLLALAIAAGAQAATWASALLWLGFTGGFCARRLRGTSRAPRHIAEMLVTSALIPPIALFWRWVGALRFRVLFV